MKCGCCEREVGREDWDYLYDCCDGCAWCQSLGLCVEPGTDTDRCCHGECHERKP